MVASLPGWGSVESVSRIASWAELSGIVFLALLVLAEIITFAYGHRESILREETTRHQEEEHSREIEDAHRRLKELQKQQAQRRLTEEQKKVLIEALSPFRGQKINVTGISSNDESKQFARDFVSVFLKAGWDFGLPPDSPRAPDIDLAFYITDPIGLQVTLNENELIAGKVPQAMRVLVGKLAELGLIEHKELIANPNASAGYIEAVVGRKLLPGETPPPLERIK